MSNTNNKINNLQKNIKRVLNGNNIIQNTNITKHCKFTTTTPTPTATAIVQTPLFNIADGEDITELLK